MINRYHSSVHWVCVNVSWGQIYHHLEQDQSIFLLFVFVNPLRTGYYLKVHVQLSV